MIIIQPRFDLIIILCVIELYQAAMGLGSTCVICSDQAWANWLCTLQICSHPHPQVKKWHHAKLAIKDGKAEWQGDGGLHGMSACRVPRWREQVLIV